MLVLPFRRTSTMLRNAPKGISGKGNAKSCAGEEQHHAPVQTGVDQLERSFAEK